MNAFPHELSGGLRQRVMIAMAVAGKPDLVIADEPTTALDVTVQAQVLGLLRDLCNELGTSFIVVTHDIGVASQIADRVAVMYGGRVAELGTMDEVLRAPSHPYTVGLLQVAAGSGPATRPRDSRPAGSAARPARAPEGMRVHAALPVGDRRVLADASRAVTRGDALRVWRPASSKAATAISRLAQETAQFRPMIEVDESRPALQVNGIDKRFPVRRGFSKRDSLHALRHVILDVEPGESSRRGRRIGFGQVDAAARRGRA